MPFETMLVIPPGAPRLISEASQERLSDRVRGEYAPRLFLMEATSICTELLEPDRTHAQECHRESGHFSKIKHPVQTPNGVSNQNR